MGFTRRKIFAGATALGLTGCGPATQGSRYDVIVVGAGVFGAWTAEYLRRAGKRVLLVDKDGPANARSSSGGESRMIRSGYGKDTIYTEMAIASLAEWAKLSARTATPILQAGGALTLFQEMVPYASETIAVHRALGAPLEQFSASEISARWPQIAIDDIAFALLEPGFGALMAQRAVQELVREFVEAGGEYRKAQATPSPSDGRTVMLDGEPMQSGAVVYACGPWLPHVFPDLLGPRIFVTRQEIAFIAPPEGDERFGPDAMPCWSDFYGGAFFYGFPAMEGRGFKLALDGHGPAFDPETGDRVMTEAGKQALRAYAERRFPALAGRPFTGFNVCAYENSSTGDFLIDRHPDLEGSWLLGGGSGHGFKHGPEIGRRMAELVTGAATAPEPIFSFATKATVQHRSVL